MSIERLLRTLDGDYGVRAAVETDSPLFDDLRSRLLAHTDLWDVNDSSSLVRSRVRYIAALMPAVDLPTAARQIHAIIDNRSVTIADVRLILQGRSLADPSRRTHEVPFDRIQMAGMLLARGKSRSDTARLTGVSVDTVEAIDVYLGISDAIDQARIAKACDAVRDGVSVRKFAAMVGVPVSTAHRMIIKARSVLAELGELS
jgi:transposase-like protein